MVAMSSHEPPGAPQGEAPSATRRDLQLGRRLFHLLNGVAVVSAYALFFTHEQVIHVFGTVACVVYVADRVRIAYPELVARHAPWVNRFLVRAEERVRESAMIPYAIAVLLTILTVPKRAALVGICALAIADPLAAVAGIRFGRHRLTRNRSLEGSLAFFAATFAIAWLVLGGREGQPPMRVAAAAATIALAGALCELVPLRLDDNLTIPLVVGFSTWIVAASFALPLS